MAKSAIRALEILEHIATERNGLTHTQISHSLGIPKSSTTVLLGDLQDMGYAQLDPTTGRYAVGPQVLALAHAYLRNLNLSRLGQPIVAHVFAAVNEFSALAIPKGDECVIVCAESSPSPLAHSLQLGEHTPLLPTASGKILLAFLAPDERETTLRRLKASRTARAELDLARRSKIAYTRGGYLAGISAIAMPVFNAQNVAIAALSVAMPSARLTPALEKKIISALASGAARLSAQLGAGATLQAA